MRRECETVGGKRATIDRVEHNVVVYNKLAMYVEPVAVTSTC